MTENEREPSREAIAQSTRVRLARNFADLPFPGRMSGEQAEQVIKRTEAALQGERPVLQRMKDLSANARGVLVERRIISPELSGAEHGAVLLFEEKKAQVMINEEDHLRIQVLRPGLALQEAMETAEALDRTLQRGEKMAFDRSWGYLTACPTNTGTGMRASVMLHLAGLTLLQQTGQVIRAVSQLGLTVRGVYGEGSEARGQLYQLSNQITLGRTEEEILRLISETAEQVIERERAARQTLMERSRLQTTDRLMRSWGEFTNARRMTNKEFFSRLSDARLAADLGLIPIRAEQLDRLALEVQPATMERSAGRALEGAERDEMRADLIRKALS